jgi:hypothetical protein
MTTYMNDNLETSPLSSSTDINDFECLDLFNEATDFNALISDEEQDEGLQAVFGDIQKASTSTGEAIHDALPIRDTLEYDFGCSWSNIRGTFDDEEGGCTVVSEESDDQSTTESELNAAMLKLSECMMRSAESRKYVEQLAQTLKKMTRTSSTPVANAAQRPAVANGGQRPATFQLSKPTTTSVVSPRRRLLSIKKRPNVVKKRQDYAVTGCLVRPIRLDRKMASISSRLPLASICNKKGIFPKKPVPVVMTGRNGKTSVSDFLRKAKRSVTYC